MQLGRQLSFELPPEQQPKPCAVAGCGQHAKHLHLVDFAVTGGQAPEEPLAACEAHAQRYQPSAAALPD
jgi:hypothetical protein